MSPDLPSLASLFRASFFYATNFIIRFNASPQKFLHTPLSGALRKCFKSGFALAKAGPDRAQKDAFVQCIGHISALIMCKIFPMFCHTKVQEGSYFWGTKDFCPNFPKLARKNFGPSAVHCMRTEFRMSSKKTTSSCYFGGHFLKSKHVGRRFCLYFSLPRFSGILRRFSQILPRLSLILPGFSEIFPGFLPNQDFWGFACTPFTPASYTTGIISSLLSALIY